MERLEAKHEFALQRIGLSATAWPIEAVTVCCGERECKVAKVDVRKAHRRTSQYRRPGNGCRGRAQPVSHRQCGVGAGKGSVHVDLLPDPQPNAWGWH
ncbi:MAG: hypothetical protein WKF37_15360 [Bryobacteraceae bacterium]